jgi:hypothetical protein
MVSAHLRKFLLRRFGRRDNSWTSLELHSHELVFEFSDECVDFKHFQGPQILTQQVVVAEKRKSHSPLEPSTQFGCFSDLDPCRQQLLQELSPSYLILRKSFSDRQ